MIETLQQRLGQVFYLNARAVVSVLIIGTVQIALGTQAVAANLSPIEELRKSFTVHGKLVPPEVFSDMGDADLADSSAIRVSIDVLAAIGSNLYADEIKVSGDWVAQIKPGSKTGDRTEETSYRFIGSTANKLLVVIAAYNGGGSGTFYTLHILDAQAGRGFDLEGKLYDRINLTVLRAVALGDRWDGSVKINGNSVVIMTTGGIPNGHDQKSTTRTIKAERP